MQITVMGVSAEYPLTDVARLVARRKGYDDIDVDPGVGRVCATGAGVDQWVATGKDVTDSLMRFIRHCLT